MAPNEHWIVTADSRRARLYLCSSLPHGRLYMDERSRLEYSQEPEHERDGPLVVGGAERWRGVGASAVSAEPHTGTLGHEPKEQARFAKQVRAWLDRSTRESLHPSVTVFAAPCFLGLLRLQLWRSPGAELREGELTHLRADELADHPAVRAAVPWLE